jgi:hypothetical protein
MDTLVIVLLVVAAPVIVIGALVWSSALRGPAPRPLPRGDSGNVPDAIPDEYSYERRMEEERRSSDEHRVPTERRRDDS